MKISGRIKKKKAVIISPDRLRELCDIIVKHCDRLEFSAETYARTSITFDSIEELLNYDNFKPRRLISLDVEGYVGYSRIISVEIGNLSISPITNYGRTLLCDYQLPSIDAETVFKNDFETWFQKAKSGYWLLGKFSFNGLLFIPSAAITLIRLLAGERAEIDLSNTVLLAALLFVIALSVALVYLLKFLDTYLLGNLFPAVVLLWGEETTRFEKWQKFRSNLLWGVIIAVLLGLMTNYLYDTLKGL